jgi:hypothetical protein
MRISIFEGDESGYLRWIRSNKTGYVINTTSRRDPEYMVLHRADCWTITEYRGNATFGGFTERDLIKICALNMDDLREWVRQNGRQDGTFSSECSHCSPGYSWDDDDLDQDD